MLDYQGLRPGDDAGASLCSRAHKGYSVQLAVPSGGSYTECADPGCQVSALDELAVYTPIQSAGAAGFSLPLFQVPADYAGQTINFYIFDVGDVSGNNQISIQNPDPTSCGGTAPCLFTSSSPVPVYDLGYSLNTAPTPSLLVNTEELVRERDDSTQRAAGARQYGGTQWLRRPLVHRLLQCPMVAVPAADPFQLRGGERGLVEHELQRDRRNGHRHVHAGRQLCEHTGPPHLGLQTGWRAPGATLPGARLGLDPIRRTTMMWGTTPQRRSRCSI